jgi:D-beta-D-heptose 7-phosphate kinase/D-beta-D-heptose 1-phosphate adenosyltransferase
MTRDRAAEILRAASTRRILVVGDLILDEFVWGKVERISPEAPVPVVHLTGESWFPGGAANVARNLHEFTSAVSIAGVTGDDDHGRKLRRLLEDESMDLSAVVTDAARPTTVKTRIIARHQQVVRVDREQAGPPSPGAAARLLDRLRPRIAAADAIIAADYAKGILQPATADLLASHTSILTIDPSPANPLAWRNATAFKPNRGEAHRVAGNGPIEEVGSRLLEHWDTKMVLITLGEDGMMLFERAAEPYHTPTRAREVFDVSGAGDTAIAVFTLALSAGAAPREAAELANAASGVVVGKLGTAVLTPQELLEALA